VSSSSQHRRGSHDGASSSKKRKPPVKGGVEDCQGKRFVETEMTTCSIERHSNSGSGSSHEGFHYFIVESIKSGIRRKDGQRSKERERER